MSERAPSTRSKGGIGPLSRLFGWAHDRWTKRLVVSTDVGNIMDDLAKYKPDRIFGSPAYLRLVADALNSGAERGIKPKTLLSFGEPLDEPMRRYLEDTFVCDVFNAYGSNETGMIAFECEAKSGLHIVQDSVIVEVLNDGKPVGEGEEGEVYVTTLRNKGMPLFRYDVGDRAVMGGHSCRCGRKSPKLRSIEGRRSDFVTSSTGRLVSPLRVGTIMHAIRGLPKYQLVEHRRSEFVLRVFQSDHGTVDELVLALKNELGDVDVRVSLERPDALRAKFRPVISMQTTP
jgi:phenylacetate-CoA ligase